MFTTLLPKLPIRSRGQLALNPMIGTCETLPNEGQNLPRGPHDFLRFAARDGLRGRTDELSFPRCPEAQRKPHSSRLQPGRYRQQAEGHSNVKKLGLCLRLLPAWLIINGNATDTVAHASHRHAHEHFVVTRRDVLRLYSEWVTSSICLECDRVVQ